MIRKLVPSSQMFHRPTPMTEAEFRWEHNQDAMAVEKLSEGIRLLPLTSANWKTCLPPNYKLCME